MRRPTWKSQLSSQRGAALVIVTMVIVILAALAAEFAFTSHVDFNILGASMNRQKARYLADAGLGAGIAMLIYDLDEDNDQQGEVGKAYDAKKGPESLAGGMDELWSLVELFPIPIPNVPDGIVNLKIEDEQGKFNINSLTDKPGVEQWTPIFDEFWAQHFACPPEDTTCVESDPQFTLKVASWVNPDPEYDLNADFYRSLEPEGYEARRAPMPILSELRLVEGFTPAFLQTIEPFLTVYPRIGVDTQPHRYGQVSQPNRPQPGQPIDPQNPPNPNAQIQQPDCTNPPADQAAWRAINVNTASLEVLAAMFPGLDEVVFTEAIQTRRNGYGRGEGPFTDVEDFLQTLVAGGTSIDTNRQLTCKFSELLTTDSSYFKITSTGIYGEVIHIREAVVHRNRARKTVDILYQRDL